MGRVLCVSRRRKEKKMELPDWGLIIAFVISALLVAYFIFWDRHGAMIKLDQLLFLLREKNKAFILKCLKSIGTETELSSFSIVLSFGKWGGFWASNSLRKGGSFRMTLGWMAITIIQPEFDVLMHRIIDRLEEAEKPNRKEQQ